MYTQKLAHVFHVARMGSNYFNGACILRKNNAKYLRCSESELLTLIDAIAFLFFSLSSVVFTFLYCIFLHSISFFLSVFFSLIFFLSKFVSRFCNFPIFILFVCLFYFVFVARFVVSGSIFLILITFIC